MPVARKTLLGAGLAAIAATAIVAPLSSGAATPAQTSAKGKTTNISVNDDYFTPSGTVTIKKGDKVKWTWSAANTDTHDVVLTSKHPKGVKAKDYRSSSGAIGITFKRKFDTPGKYGFVCTYHKTVMKVDLTVKKKKKH